MVCVIILGESARLPFEGTACFRPAIRDETGPRSARVFPRRPVGSKAGAPSTMATKELLMEPTVAGGPGDLNGLRLDLLRRAAEIYLELAYPAGAVPDAVQ